jgi:hypothetical protein
LRHEYALLPFVGGVHIMLVDFSTRARLSALS